MKKLTVKQQRFIEEYCIDFNGTQAAIRAGYSKKTANEQAARLLANVSISEAVQTRLKAISEKAEVDAERITKELAAVGFANMGNYMRVGMDGLPSLSFDDLTEEQKAALSEVTVETRSMNSGDGDEIVMDRKVKFKLWDKLNALEKLARRVEYYPKETQEGTTININQQIVEVIESAAESGRAKLDRLLANRTVDITPSANDE